jgi:hypothetical protein
MSELVHDRHSAQIKLFEFKQERMKADNCDQNRNKSKVTLVGVICESFIHHLTDAHNKQTRQNCLLLYLQPCLQKSAALNRRMNGMNKQNNEPINYEATSEWENMWPTARNEYLYHG